MPDITVRNEGSIFLLTPRTVDATEFLEVNTDGQWFGASLVVEHRYVADLEQRARRGHRHVRRHHSEAVMKLWKVTILREGYPMLEWTLRTERGVGHLLLFLHTSFANAQGFFPPYTSQLTGGSYSSNQLLSGFAKAATNTQISPMNAKNWATADATDLVIPTMMKQLMKGANFDSTVAAANTKLQDVLNNGSQG